MNTTFLFFGFVIVTCIAIGVFVYHKHYKEIHDLKDYINRLEQAVSLEQDENIKTIANINSKIYEINNNLNSHVHKYEFKDGILYIKEPLFQKNIKDYKKSKDYLIEE